MIEVQVANNYELTPRDRELIKELADASGWTELELALVRRALGEWDQSDAERIMRGFTQRELPPLPGEEDR